MKAAADRIRTIAAQAVALVFLALLAGCGTLPANVERAPSKALGPAAGSPLALLAANSIAEPGLTGFRLLPLGPYALGARIELARRAHESIDAQYYLIANDRTGRFFMRELRDAALRGVRIRLLVDDLYTAGSDDMFRGLAAFPNVEVRLFNPFCCARDTIPGKYVASLGDFTRLNHRMHNKLFVVDGAIAVMGGRNIADEYFTRSATNNFVDMDVLAAGGALPRLQSIFDIYWNSPQAYPIQGIVPAAADPASLRRAFDALVDEGDQMTTITPPSVDILGYGPITEDLDSGRLGLVWGRAIAFADPPAKVMAASTEEATAMSVQMDIMARVNAAKKDVIVSSPYFIPGERGVRELAELASKSVRVMVLTNSLAATDEPLVHIGYARYRVALLQNGIELYELSPGRSKANERLALPGQSLGRLHAKAAVIDQTTVYIGSMNLDPRSDSTNTELGLVAECPELAREVARALRVSGQMSAYRVRLVNDPPELEWVVPGDEQGVAYSVEPESSAWLRFKNKLLSPFVPEHLL
jgi:putative cardiolipin synthase